MTTRKFLAALLVAFLAVACGGGAISVLHAKGKKGDGPARVDVQNSSGETVSRLFIAKTEDVDRARAAGASPGSPEDEAVWGEDHLGNAGIADGSTFAGIELPEGRYDVLAVASGGQEQLVKALKIRAGGRYVLEIGTAWRQGR